jgi:shikimate kinase
MAAMSQESSAGGETREQLPRDDGCALRALLGSRSVVLVGMMGAGKSSVGRRLAAALDLPFLDADSEIERAACLSIEEIFRVHGEAYFRDGEERVIKRLLSEGPIVLATGGGAFMSPRIRACVAAQGVSVWLRADLDLLMQRVLRRDNRPLLKTADPRATMERLLQERAPVYALADIAVDSREVAHEEIVHDVMTALIAFLGGTGRPVSSCEENANV